MRPYQSFRNGSGRRRLWAITALIVFLYLADVLSGGKIRAQVRVAGAFVSQWGGALERTIFGSWFFSSRASLAAQNRSLLEQLAQYQERAASVAALEEENMLLRQIAHLAESSLGITAPVISSVRSSPYGTFLIGAGSAEGIGRGNAVLTPSGFIVGTVTDAATHTAIVTEVFAPAASVEGIIRGSAITIEGRGGGNAYARVPRGLEIAVGDAVTVPLYGGRPAGVVGEIASSSASAAQDVYIRIPANLASLQFVYVVSSR